MLLGVGVSTDAAPFVADLALLAFVVVLVMRAV
jgi:hypothetical protein